MWIFLFFAFSLAAEEELVTVRIPSGTIIGKSIEVSNVRVNTFLGVPYAEPPVGDLRFKRSEKIEKHPTPIEAFEFGSSCYQTTLEIQDYIKAEDVFDYKEFSEDCLFLNIWAPDAKHTAEEKKAVMVWIHGGGFLFGETGYETYKGDSLASLGNVIVVTMNYRLGVFGFFTSGTEEESGDQGLYDQNMALRWIKDNIEYFGGDPGRITLFGESAGGISVGYHLLSNHSSDLFHRAILQSGTSNTPILLKTKSEMISISHKFAQLLGCNRDEKDIFNNPKSILTCLRGKSAKELTEKETVLLKQPERYMQFAPLTYGGFASASDFDNIDPNNFKNKDIMIGTTKDEMASLYFYFHPKMYIPSSKPESKEDFYNVMKDFYSKNYDFEKIKPLLDHHFNAVECNNDTEASEIAMCGFLSDIFFTCPASIFANWYAKYQKIYYYYFTQHSQNVYFQLLFNDRPGAFHFDDVQYVFGIPLRNSSYGYTDEEKQLAKDMIMLWTSFAKYGKPSSKRHPEWPPYSKLNPQVLELNGVHSNIMPLPHFERCRLFFDSESPSRVIAVSSSRSDNHFKEEL